ncbi:MAG: cysteine dioxygenase family protein [Saprospiraceae bacterium]
MGIIETTETIDTLGDLIRLLQETPTNELGELPFDPDALAVDLEPFAIWKDGCYTRICLHRDSRVELILLCWSPSASTAVHCHAGSECWMHICEGELTESAYDIDDETITHVNTRTISSGDRAHINDEKGLHMLANTSKKRSMSLHLYSPAVGACQMFDVLTKESTWVTLKYDRVLSAEDIG